MQEENKRTDGVDVSEWKIEKEGIEGFINVRN